MAAFISYCVVQFPSYHQPGARVNFKLRANSLSKFINNRARTDAPDPNPNPKSHAQPKKGAERHSCGCLRKWGQCICPEGARVAGTNPDQKWEQSCGLPALVFDVTLIFKSGVHIKVTQRSRMADITVPSSPSALSPSTSSSSSSS